MQAPERLKGWGVDPYNYLNMMGKTLLLMTAFIFLCACTPKVREVSLKRGDVIVVKKGQFFFTEEEREFIKEEARKLGIEIPDRREIREQLERFLRDRRSLEIALRRANLYIPYIKPVLRSYGLPEELALLPLVESGFNPFAVSRSGAGGIWQLMPFTARKYGLRVSREIDERFDLLKSTHAAARYLRDLYRMFGNWELALAAYNCGEGCVKRRTGGSDFWRKKRFLPEQTRKYVPRFFAALLIARSPHRYGLRVRVDTLRIERRVVSKRKSLRKLISEFGLRESTFRDMNPHLRGSHVPPGSYVYLPRREPSPKPSSAEKGDTQVIVLDNGAVLYIKK